MRFNDQQLAVARYYLNNDGNIAAIASAGCGKTSLLIGLSKLVKTPMSFALFAFTKNTADHLSTKLPNLTGCVSTTYSAGLKALTNHLRELDESSNKIEVKANKYEDIYHRLVDEPWNQETWQARCKGAYPVNDKMLRTMVLQHLNICMLNLWLTPDKINQYLSEVWEFKGISRYWVAQVIQQSINIGVHELQNWSVVSFTDMVVYPTVLGCKVKQYKTIFVDEAQDLSKAQRMLIKASLMEGGQLVIVGDPRQAIYNFSGSDLHSFQNFVDEFSCKKFRLKVNYRSATEIIRFAQELDPYICAKDNAPKGEVFYLTESDAISYLHNSKEPVLVVSRTHYRLISLAISLTLDGVPFTYQNGNFTKMLTAIIQWYMSDCLESLTMVEWVGGLCEHVQPQTRDLLDCVLAFQTISGLNGNKLISYIRKFFADCAKESAINLSTIHAAKGQEKETVVYWGINLLPHPNAQTMGDLESESNLDYVARTRAIEKLILVEL